jgi:hypothetical protein
MRGHQAYEEQIYCPTLRLSHNPMIFGFQERNRLADTLRVLVVYESARLSQLSPLLTCFRLHAIGTHMVPDTVQSSESVAACRSPVVTPYCCDRLAQPAVLGDKVWPEQFPALEFGALELLAGSVPGGR